MRQTPLLLFTGLCLMLSAPSRAQDGGALIAEVMKRPGSWDQMCGLPRPIPFDVPVPLVSDGLVRRYFSLGNKEAARLREARPAVVAALVQKLTQMDFAKPPEVQKEIAKNQDAVLLANLNPDWLNAVHLQIIANLNAVETLPQLLRLEDQLATLLTAAEKDSKAPLPPLDLDSPVSFYKRGSGREPDPDSKYWDSPAYKRERAVFVCRVMQRELLGTISLLLMNERWPAAVDRFSVETKKAREAAVADAKAAINKAKARLEAKPDAEETERLQADISYQEAVIRGMQAGTMPVAVRADYTTQLRGEIRSLAESYLKSVPPEKRQAGAAMPKPPASP